MFLEFSLADGRMGLSILPLAALLTGTCFTLGIAILFVVLLALRRRRCQGGRGTCDDKDKHLGELNHFSNLRHHHHHQHHHHFVVMLHTTTRKDHQERPSGKRRRKYKRKFKCHHIFPSLNRIIILSFLSFRGKASVPYIYTHIYISDFIVFFT